MNKLINETRLKNLCKLAKIEIKEEETEKYLNLLNNSLNELEKLDEIEANDLEPLVNPYEVVLKEYPDIVSDGNVVEELMKCAPKELYNYFVVPKVIDN